MSAAQSVTHGNHHRNFVNITQTNAVCSGSTFMVALPAGAGVMSIMGFAAADSAGALAFGLQRAQNENATRVAVAARNSQAFILQAQMKNASTNEKGPAHSPGLRQFGCGGRI